MTLLRRTTAGLALLAALGCAPTNPGISIQGLKLPDEAACLYAVDDVFVARPILDVSIAARDTPAPGGAGFVRPFGITYDAALQVANRMINLGNSRYPVQADPNPWVAEQAVVELRSSTGAPLALGGPNPFMTTASGTVPSAANEITPGRGIVTVNVIPPEYGDAIGAAAGVPPAGTPGSATITVSVTLIGTTLGGSTQSTGPFVFPIALCDHCLFQCVCGMGGTWTYDPSCRPGQDRLTQACLTGDPVCP